MAEILVRGRAEARLAPTSASLTITVRVATARSQEEAVDRAATRCQTVDAAIDGRRGSLVKGAVDFSVRTGQEWDHTNKGRRLLGYFATRSTDVECEPNGEELTTFLRDVSALKEVQVNGPRWRIAPDAPGYDALRRDAAADALRKAEAYAAGLGRTVGRVEWIAEPGLRKAGGASGGRPEGFAGPAAPRAMARAGAAEEDEPTLVRIQPEPIRVSVDVEVAFSLED